MEESSTYPIKDDFKKYYDIIGDAIGNGAFGCVYKGKKKDTGIIRAIKVINLGRIEENLLNQFEADQIDEELEKYKDEFLQEYKNMTICSNKNENSVKVYECFSDEENLF